MSEECGHRSGVIDGRCLGCGATAEERLGLAEKARDTWKAVALERQSIKADYARLEARLDKMTIALLYGDRLAEVVRQTEGFGELVYDIAADYVAVRSRP